MQWLKWDWQSIVCSPSAGTSEIADVRCGRLLRHDAEGVNRMAAEAGTESDYDTLGWTMLGLVMTGPVEGWSLWAEFVAPRLGLESPGTKDKLPPEYRSFKRALTDLADRGFVTSTGKGRTRGRLTWDASEDGLRWWEAEGSEKHGPNRCPSSDDIVPMKKWLGSGRMSRAQWAMMMRKVQTGELEVAFRPSN